MLNFMEITEEQLDEYIDTHQDRREQKEKQNLIDEIGFIGKRLLRLKNKLDRLKEHVHINNFEHVFEQCHEMSRYLSKESSYLNELPGRFGEKKAILKIKEEYIQKKEVLFEIHGDVVRIRLPELIPHRPAYDSTTGRIRYKYDIDVFRASYYNAFLKQFEYGKQQIYGGSVVICYIHHFKQLQMAPDPDNIDTKPMTDIITTFLLTDDSFPYCSQYHKGVEDKEEYTEIIIAPEEKMWEIIKKGHN